MISLMLSPLSPWIVSVTGDFLSSVDRVVAIPFNYFAKEKTRRPAIFSSAYFTKNKNEYIPIPQNQIGYVKGIYKQNAGF